MHALDPIHAANAVSGVLFMGLGVFVASVRSRERVNIGFALFAASFGAFIVLLNALLQVGHRSEALNHLSAVLSIGACIGIILVATSYPQRVADIPRHQKLGALLFGMVLAVLIGSIYLLGRLELDFPTRLNYAIIYGPFQGAMWGTLALFAFRYKHVDTTTRKTYVLMSAALVLYPSYFVAAFLARGSLLESTMLLAPLALAALWLWNTALGDGRGARHVALLTLAAPLLGLIERASFPGAIDQWGFGVVRTLSVVILAYAIIRHQLLGIDLKLRWAVSKTTIGAAFITVFFIVSSLAQNYFEDNLGPFVGIVAAGALVFALAPLQSFADSIARAAIPLAAPQAVTTSTAGAMRDAPDEAAYRAAVRLATRNGPIDRAQEHDLALIAERLRLGPKRALEIRDEVERA